MIVGRITAPRTGAWTALEAEKSARRIPFRSSPTSCGDILHNGCRADGQCDDHRFLHSAFRIALPTPTFRIGLLASGQPILVTERGGARKAARYSFCGRQFHHAASQPKKKQLTDKEH